MTNKARTKITVYYNSSKYSDGSGPQRSHRRVFTIDTDEMDDAQDAIRETFFAWRDAKNAARRSGDRMIGGISGAFYGDHKCVRYIGDAPEQPAASAPAAVEPEPITVPEPISEPLPTAPAFRYIPLYRPPSFNCLPKGWTLVERPRDGYDYARRTDLPLSEYPHGVVEYDRPLTAHEITSYQLREVACR